VFAAFPLPSDAFAYEIDVLSSPDALHQPTRTSSGQPWRRSTPRPSRCDAIRQQEAMLSIRHRPSITEAGPRLVEDDGKRLVVANAHTVPLSRTPERRIKPQVVASFSVTAEDVEPSRGPFGSLGLSASSYLPQARFSRFARPSTGIDTAVRAGDRIADQASNRMAPASTWAPASPGATQIDSRRRRVFRGIADRIGSIGRRRFCPGERCDVPISGYDRRGRGPFDAKGDGGGYARLASDPRASPRRFPLNHESA